MIKSKYLNFIHLMHNEQRSLDELFHYQNIRLKRLVSHAYKTVPFYKKLFDYNKVHPNDIESIEDISRLPIIDKEIIRQNSFDDLISRNYEMENLIPITTTGSSGTMFQFFIDKSFDQFRKAQFLRPYFTNGKRFFDKTLVFSAPKSSAKKWFHHLGVMNEKRIFYNTSTQEQIEAIKEIKPAIIQGCASVLNLLALTILDEKSSVPKPRLIFTDSEVLTGFMRNNIKNAFGAEVIDIYGTYETDNIAYECHHHRGYHIAIDCVIMEFISGERSIRPFEEGEVVVTVLNNLAMPLIRYNLHDVSSYSNERCPCGRTLPLLKKIQGRSDDYMITADGRRLSFVNLGSYWHPLTKFVHEFQLIQENINDFTVFIVPSNSFNDECREIICSEISKYFPGAKIDIKLVSAIERLGPGKFKTFITKLND